MRIPLGTYRLQLNRQFTFRDATALVPYLDALGISDIYASPFLAARAGSQHGYDVVDPTRLNPEIGSDDDLLALAAALRARGMGLLMDLVPNHMCIATSDNRWWNDVLENGRSSPYARIFDIDWQPPKPELAEKVLLPVLGEQYGRVLEDQQIAIGYDGGAFHCRYGDARFPVGPRTVRPILEPIVADLKRRGPDDAPDLMELESILTAVRHLPTRWETNEEQIRERQREKEIVKRRIAALVSAEPSVREALDRNLATLNGRKGDPRSFDALEALLADQAYRLSFWGVAAEEINYRRFFDINELAAIRIEDPLVLELVHAKPFQLLREGTITGLRIDHVDGLVDPARYLAYLQNHHTPGHTPDAEAPSPTVDPPYFVVVEKILTGEERLPSDWPVHGTTGYDFLNVVNGLFIDGEGARVLDRIYQRISGSAGDFDELLYRMKKLILDSSLSSELYVLARRLDRISEQHRWSRDFTLNSLHRALGELVASFPVYRSYVSPSTVDVSPDDRRHILTALRNAKRRNQAMSRSLFDFIADIWLLRDPEGLADTDRVERRELVARLQQLTGPVMAKGLEDTAFYRYYPLSSLNEVGGSRRYARAGAGTGEGGAPEDGDAMDIDAFHRWNAERCATWPHALSASATHDTKRGEDMRARLSALSEIPRQWQAAFRRWQRLNRRHRQQVEEAVAPDTNEEYLLYQTLVGAWPMELPAAEPGAGGAGTANGVFTDRVCAYMNKALKEAKQHTSWINVNEPYERAVETFIRLIMEPHPRNLFLREIEHFQRDLARPGMLTSLAQTIIKITAPGIPDFFQGTELWDQSLVDPDNRRPVDFARRRAVLEALDAHDGEDPAETLRRLLAAPEDGAIKLHITRAALRHRRRWRDLYRHGRYIPLPASGPRKRHAVAFARLGRALNGVSPSHGDTGHEAHDDGHNGHGGHNGHEGHNGHDDHDAHNGHNGHDDHGGHDARTPESAGTSIVIVGRLFTTLAKDGAGPTDAGRWAGTLVPLDPRIAAVDYRDVLSGRIVRPRLLGAGPGAFKLEDVFADLPAAILEPVA